MRQLVLWEHKHVATQVHYILQLCRLPGVRSICSFTAALPFATATTPASAAFAGATATTSAVVTCSRTALQQHVLVLF